MLLKTYLFYSCVLCCSIKLLLSLELELLPLEQSDPNLLAYARSSIDNNVNLNSFVFACQHCFVLVSLFNNVDISYIETPIFLSYLYPIKVKTFFEPATYVPMDLAVRVKNKGFLVVSNVTQSKFCLSKFYTISRTVCSHIELTEFTSYIKPWNFEQYVYVLPSNENGKINTLWTHTKQNKRKLVHTNVIGIVISIENQKNVIWLLEKFYVIFFEKFCRNI